MTGAGDGRPGGGTPEDDRPGADGEDGGERGERIARFLARAGIASRRAAETLIAEGRVKLGGRVVETPATFVSPGDAVSVDGRAVAAPEHTRLFRHHKPDGLVTTHKDPQGRPTVFEKLPAGLPRLISVGRLDLNSEGLLLLTNDGALARKLELPSNGWRRPRSAHPFALLSAAQRRSSGGWTGGRWRLTQKPTSRAA